MKATICVLWTAGVLAAAQAPGGSPIEVEMVPKRAGFARFHHREHVGNRIGYRFHEHTPLVEGTVPRDAREAGIDAERQGRLVREFAAKPGVLRHEIDVNGKEWVRQKWTFWLAPAADGIELLLQVEAGEAGLPAYYGVQQCFRMSGATNEAWRQEVARAPAFSEFDFWKELAAAGKEAASLTWVPRKASWEELPARAETVGARTALGLAVDRRRTGGDLSRMPKVGPYEALMLEAMEDGPIARVSRDRRWISAIYWERTSHVSDHHPADCLHTIVNIGGIPAGGTRVVRGKIYWFRGGLKDLRMKWGREFPQ